MKTIEIKKIINSPYAVSVDDADILYHTIYPLIEDGIPFTLDFYGIEEIVPAFLNASIGKFYENYEEEIDKLMTTRLYNPLNIILMQICVGNAKKYYKNPEKYDAAWEEILNDL